MSFKNFVDGVANAALSSRGGGDFLSLSDGVNVFRLFYDERGEAGLNFFQHWVDRGVSVVCKPKTFGDDSYCETCEQVRLLREAGDKKSAHEIAVRPQTWLCAVSKDGERIGILGITGATMQKVMAAMAQVGGWSGDPDWEDPEFLEMAQEGMDACYGPEARDLIITKNTKALPRDMYKVRFSSKSGKKLSPENEAPNLLDTFRTVKKLDQAEKESKPKRTRRRVPAKKKAATRKKATTTRKKSPAKKKAGVKKAPAKRRTTRKEK